MKFSRMLAGAVAVCSALVLSACGSSKPASDSTSHNKNTATPTAKDSGTGIQPKLENGTLYGVVLSSPDRDTRFGELGLEETLILGAGKGKEVFGLHANPRANTHIQIICSSRKTLGVPVDESNIISGAVYYRTVKDGTPVAFVDSRWINTAVPGSASGDEAPPCFFGSKEVIKKAG